VGVRRQVRDHGRHDHRLRAVVEQRPADGALGFAEVFLRRAAREHEGVRPVERAVEAARDDWELEHLKHVRVGPRERFIGLEVRARAALEEAAIDEQARDGFKLRIVAREP
jgi:hypothetical protein